MTQFIFNMNSKSANCVSVVLYTCPLRKILERMLSRKYAVQSPISVGSEYMPYAFLKRVEFPNWTL